MTEQQARIEAERCLYCFDAPCARVCPVHIDIPGFISMIRSANIRGASEVVRTSHAMANVCGKVCPEEVFCQSVCLRAKADAPIQIRELHFFATQFEAHIDFSSLMKPPQNGRKIAVVGGGPSGLSCAFELSKLGYRVTLFDGKNPGGVPNSSIPAFRLSDDELQDDVRFLCRHFVVKRERITHAKFKQLRNKNDAVFVAVGLGRDRPLGLKGETLRGVYPALKFLETTKSKQRKIFTAKRVVVIGGGNVSLDAAAVAKRLGASDVTLVYRRGESEMRVWKSELSEARKQGIEFRFLTNPVEILGKKTVHSVRCVRMRLLKRKDQTGRRMPVEVSGSEFPIPAETVVVAIGQIVAEDVLKDFRRTSRGYIEVNEQFQTSEKGVFAGGDVIAGEGTIVQSVAHGKYAARAIHEYVSRQKSNRPAEMQKGPR